MATETWAAIALSVVRIGVGFAQTLKYPGQPGYFSG
jgi:hypothetical protein